MSLIEDEVTADILDSGRAGALAIRGSAIRALGYGAAVLASLVSVPFMTRHLGDVDYGYYATVNSLLFILVGSTEAGLTSIGTREYSLRAGHDRDMFLRDLVGLRLALTVAGILVAVAFTAVTGRPSQVVVGTAIMGVGILLGLTQQTYSVPLTAELRLGWLASLELLRQVVMSVCIIALVLVDASLVPFYFATVVGGIAVLMVTLLVLRRDAGVIPAYHPEAWMRILRQTLSYALAAAVGLVYFRLALIVLGFVGTKEQVGSYGVAFRAVETLGVLPFLLISSAFPILIRAARDDADRMRYATGRVFDVSVLIGTLLGLGLVIGAPFVIQVIGGGEFASSVGVLRILGLCLLTSCFVAGSVFTLLSLERYRDLLVANVVAMLAAGVLTVILVPSMGAKGAAVATLAAEALLVAGYFVGLGRHDRKLVPRPMVLIRVIPPAAAMLGVAAVLHVHPVIEAGLGGIAFILVAFATGAVPPELWKALLHRDDATQAQSR